MNLSLIGSQFNYRSLFEIRYMIYLYISSPICKLKSCATERKKGKESVEVKREHCIQVFPWILAPTPSLPLALWEEERALA